MNTDTKTDVSRRLASIEGHLAGIRRMIENDGYCVDVMKQTFAVRRAIEKLETVLLNNHLHTCLIDGIRDGREEAVVGELLELYSLNNK